MFPMAQGQKLATKLNSPGLTLSLQAKNLNVIFN